MDRAILQLCEGEKIVLGASAMFELSVIWEQKGLIFLKKTKSNQGMYSGSQKLRWVHLFGQIKANTTLVKRPSWTRSKIFSQLLEVLSKVTFQKAVLG